LLMATKLTAQTPKVLDSGTPGIIEATINADTDPGDRIYELKAGKAYIQQGPIVVNHPDGSIIIRGQTGGPKPVIIKMPVGDVNIGTNTINSSLTIQNVEYLGMETNSNLPWQLFLITGNNHHLLVEDCLFEHSAGPIFDMDGVAAGAEIRIRNNYFRDMNDFTQWWQARVVGCKVPVDTFIFENNTVTGAGLMVLGQQCLFEYSVINHNTIVNNHKYPFLNQYWKEVYFTNNLFVNSNMVGEDMENVANSGQDPDKLLEGISGVDTIENSINMNHKFWKGGDSTILTEEVDGLDDIIYYAADNVVTYSTTLDNYYNGTVDGIFTGVDGCPASYLNWAGLGTGPWKVLSVPGVWANSRTQALIAAWPNIKDENNSIYEIPLSELGLGTDPMPQDAADIFIQWNRNAWGVPDITSPTDYSAYYFGDHNPATVPGVETEAATAGSGGITKISDMIEDFSYTKTLTSKSDGMRIGALHWNDEAFDSKTSLERVKKAYNGIHYGINELISSSVLDLRNYPNPFNSTTKITFNLPKNTHVNLSVYDISGRLVETLINENRAGGKYTLEFTPDYAAGGTYFYKLTTDFQVATSKMILLK
jgi:hypothetical protein